MVYVSCGTVRSVSLLEGGRSAPRYAIQNCSCDDIVIVIARARAAIDRVR
jgi:hypothetical protein